MQGTILLGEAVDYAEHADPLTGSGHITSAPFVKSGPGVKS
jgi:hypothetical protein